jgi:hypothetical protein
MGANSTNVAGTLTGGSANAAGTCTVGWVGSPLPAAPYCVCSSSGLASGSNSGDAVGCRASTTQLILFDAGAGGISTEIMSWNCIAP